MIGHVYHYFRKGSRPFQNLSSLPEAEALELMKTLYVPGSVLWQRFGNPVQYLRLRRQVEQQLLSQFRKKGGRPRQDYPVYFVVGRPRWAFAAADAVTMELTDEVQVPLSVLKEDEISFTWPDSMYCAFFRALGQDPGIDGDLSDRVFTLGEIEALITARGLPADGWRHDLPAGRSHYVEMQAWNREALEEYLLKAAPGPPSETRRPAS